ncbi:MAG TPA: galactokinase family protein [Spirochaetales bacterium]|nr:galactokinase family protein [Spirochaetales bacterium]
MRARFLSEPKENSENFDPGLPRLIPRLASLAELYDAGELEAQALRYRGIESGLFARFPERRRDCPLFFSTPGRTELCGNHTDHNGGMVLAAAVNLDMVAAALPRTDTLVRIHSQGFGGFEVDIREQFPRPEERASSQALVRGMAEGLSRLARKESGTSGRNSGSGREDRLLCGFDAYIDSRVPSGSGLSSSAAFEVLVGSILAVFSGLKVSPAELAMVGKEAENRHFGKPSGLMDQTACALGSLALIDFADPGRAAIRLLNFDPGEFGYGMAIVSAGDSHADLTEEYASIPREMKAIALKLGRESLCGTTRSELREKAAELRTTCGDRAFLRAWHFAGETLRPQALAKAIESKNIETYFRIVKASGDSSYKYLQNILPGAGSASQGLAFALALTEDFLEGKGACRVHGGGFAGTIQAYIPLNRTEEYHALMEKNFGTHSLYWIKTRRHGAICIDPPSRSSR